jgi:MazG family protein
MSTTPFAEKGPVLQRMLALCARLRGDDGCTWDREQTLSTLTPYLLEEVHEVLDAVASQDPTAIREELGDLLFVTVFALHAAETESIATTEEIVDGNVEKLVRRHPHVFGDHPNDRASARRAWQQAKRAEGGASDPSVLGELPRSRPALLAAFRLQERAAAVGFDWPDVQGPLAKVAEELDELRECAGDPDRARDELGDLLFAAANVGRHLSLDPEVALQSANRRFYERFRHIEDRLAEEGRSPEDATLEELDALWNEAKSKASPPAEG